MGLLWVPLVNYSRQLFLLDFVVGLVVPMQGKVFALSEARGPYFQPHSALSIHSDHGFQADEDTFGEDDGNVRLCFGFLFSALGGVA